MNNISRDNNNSSKRTTKIFSEWLETLQQESWQLELLISGFALFGIWESRILIDKIMIYLELSVPQGTIEVASGIFGTFLSSAWIIFIVNLLVHIVLRGFWIGAIGLRYVSGEIDYDELGYSDIFNRYFRRKVGRFDDYIEKLERICSIIFAYTFLLFFLFLSTIAFFAWGGLLISILVKLNLPGLFVVFPIILFLIIGLVGAIDFISFGAFKRITDKTLSRVFFVIYLITSTLTFSFLYRPLLLNFIDDKYTRKLLLISFPYFILLLLVFPMLQIQSHTFFPDFTNLHKSSVDQEFVQWKHYDDLREDHRKYNASIFTSDEIITTVSLKNFEIREDMSSLFLRITSDDTDYYKKYKGYTPFLKSGIRHKFFSKFEKDSLFQQLKMNEKASMDKFKEYRSKNKDRFDKSIWDRKRDSIGTVQAEAEKEFFENKLNAVKESTGEIYTIRIDGAEYNDSLTCKFFIHPNKGEKGMLCYFPTGSLDNGAHMMHITKRRHNSSSTDSLRRRQYYLPFMKL